MECSKIAISGTMRLAMETIQGIHLRLNLTIHNCRVQCYDGASNMSGAKSGVATKLKDSNPRALYTHCLCVRTKPSNTRCTQAYKIMKEAMDTVHEITKLIKKSPTHETLF